jgi:hypothetical protein
MPGWDQLATAEAVARAVATLAQRGIRAQSVAGGAAARQVVLTTVPPGALVMNMTSQTLLAIGVVDDVLRSGRYRAVRHLIAALDPETQLRQRLSLGAAPEWALGSVHAITEDGQVYVASRSGSQLAAYAYGAQHVLWVVGTHKIVADHDAALRRIHERSAPLEDARVKALGQPGSFVGKLLTIENESNPERLQVVFVDEVLGF